MYGVPPDLDLSLFAGAVLTQICLGQFDIQFKFHPPCSIGVEGHWELRDSSGVVIDQSGGHDVGGASHVHILLGRRVIGSKVNAPESFELIFDDATRLAIYDSQKQFESFSIQPGDVFV